MSCLRQLIRYSGNQDEHLVISVVAAHVAAHRAVDGPIYVYSGTGHWPASGSDDQLLARVGERRSDPAWTVEELVVYSTTSSLGGFHSR